MDAEALLGLELVLGLVALALALSCAPGACWTGRC